MLLAAGSEHDITLALWRAVEAQHIVATMVLVDTREEQRLLEELLDEAKPPVPAAAQSLHYLLSTPFRYPSPWGSRFRRPTEPGTLYGAEEVRTSCAELGYWRWRFLLDSPALTRLDSMPQTVFRFGVSGRGIDLRTAPYLARKDDWMHRSDYTMCQALGSEARMAGVAIIRYASVRDPAHAGCAAVLLASAIDTRSLQARETWYLLVQRERVRWWRTEGSASEPAFDFDAAMWQLGS